MFGCGCGLHASRRLFLRSSIVGAATLAAPAIGTSRVQAATGDTAPAVRPAPAGARVIDTHCHYYPQGYLDLMAADGKPFGADYRPAPNGFYFTALGATFGPLPSKFIDLKQRIADMDAQGVTIQAMSLTSPMVYFGDKDFNARLARAWNDGAVEAHKQYPDRLLVLATLPMLDTDDALKELDRAKSLPGVRGVYMGTNINNLDLDDKRFLPVFKAAEQLGLPVFLHPQQTVGGERMKPFYLSNLIGNPLDTGIAAAHLIMGGVMDACPNLNINLAHAGGVVPILVGRWDRGRDVRPELKHMTRAPSDYLRRFTYDTIAHSAPIMKFVISMVGADRITVGDDYCFDMGYEHPVAVVDQLKLSAQDRKLVLGGNAARLLKI